MVSGDWSNEFYETDCSQSNISIFGSGNASKLIIYLIYLIFVVCTGYIYGRHKGLSQYNERSMMEKFSDLNLKTKIIDLGSKIWFILSTFLFPWYFCVIWLFYVIHFNDINYINSYNPWIIPFICIYCCYSISVILSYSSYCNFKRDKYAPLMIKTSILFAGCYGMFMFYILIKHRETLNEWKIDGFYGSHILHCFDFDAHKNPTLFLVLFMIYCLITHHIFVILRAITAKICYNQYISKKKQFEKAKSKRSNRKREEIEKIYERRCVIDPRGGIRAPAYVGNGYGANKYEMRYSSDDDGIDEYDIDDFEENESDSEFDAYNNVNDNADNADNADDNEYVRKPSNSKSKQYKINLTPEPSLAPPPEFKLVSSVDPSDLKMSSADASPSASPQPPPVQHV